MNPIPDMPVEPRITFGRQQTIAETSASSAINSSLFETTLQEQQRTLTPDDIESGNPGYEILRYSLPIDPIGSPGMIEGGTRSTASVIPDVLPEFGIDNSTLDSKLATLGTPETEQRLTGSIINAPVSELLPLNGTLEHGSEDATAVVRVQSLQGDQILPDAAEVVADIAVVDPVITGTFLPEGGKPVPPHSPNEPGESTEFEKDPVTAAQGSADLIMPEVILDDQTATSLKHEIVNPVTQVITQAGEVMKQFHATERGREISVESKTPKALSNAIQERSVISRPEVFTSTNNNESWRFAGETIVTSDTQVNSNTRYTETGNNQQFSFSDATRDMQSTVMETRPLTPASLLTTTVDPVRLTESTAGAQRNMSLLINTPINQPGWGNEIGREVHWLIQQNQQTAELRLNPAELGSIEVLITTKDDRASIMFFVQNSDAHEALEATLPRLRDALAGSGIQLGDAKVSQQSLAEHSRQPADRRGNADADNSAQENSLISAETGDEVPMAIGIDAIGLIDTFI